MLGRIGDRGAGCDELGLAAVQRADAAQPPQHAGHLRAEDPAIGVRLVDHHEAQVAEKAAPQRVVGQDADVQHVGVGEDDLAVLAQPAAAGLGRVAVVRADRDRQRRCPAAGPALDRAAELLERPQLVLRQRLGGIQIKRPRGRPLQNRLKHRQVVAQRLAAGRAGDHDHVPAGKRGVDRLGLVGEKAVDALGLRQLALESGMQRGAQHAIGSAAPRDLLQVDELALVEGLALEVVEESGDVHTDSAFRIPESIAA